MGSKHGTSSSSTTTTFQTHSRTHDVFLSFRGKDTRSGFAFTLYRALQRANINTFFDDGGLTPGDNISAALFHAIQVSRISVVICSKNYASSKWCLDELNEILRCQKSLEQIVIPVFYKVNPANVRYQSGSFGEGFLTTRLRYKEDEERIKKWTAALTEVANLSGLTYVPGADNCYKEVFADRVVTQISNVLEKAKDGARLHNEKKNEAAVGEFRSSSPPPVLPKKVEAIRMPTAKAVPLPKQGNSLLDRFEKICPPGGENKLVLYTTTYVLDGVSFVESNDVRAAIRNLGVIFSERDISSDSVFSKELSDLLYKKEGGEWKPPKLFLRGRYLGGLKEVMAVLDKVRSDKSSKEEFVRGLPTRVAETRYVCEACQDKRIFKCSRCRGRAQIFLDVQGTRKVDTCPDCRPNGTVLCSICM